MNCPLVCRGDLPLLCAGVFTTHYDRPIEQCSSPEWLTAYFRSAQDCPLSCNEETRTEVRKLLRFGGFKPSGRSKPACEFLQKVYDDGSLASINLPVDLCNVASLWSGFPISVVDLDRVVGGLHIETVAAQEQDPQKREYVFNPSGQVLDLRGLLCLWDESGPCGSPVKDSQRTKTQPQTTRTLSVVWGTASQAEQVAQTLQWYKQITSRAGGQVLEG